jgi:hypothetical protein
MRIDAATAGVLRGFEHAGVRALLLKGPSVASWLYGEDGTRVYVDCDLLVGPAQIAAAEEVLASLGYWRSFDERSMPPWWRPHATEWVRQDRRLTVDLHHRLPGVLADAESAWNALAADSTAMLVGGYPARSLGVSARVLHLALHAGHHGSAYRGPIADLERALSTLEPGLWARAATLAAELDASDAFVAGLCITSEGAEVARRLGLSGPRSVEAQLRAGAPPPVALGFGQFVGAHGTRRRTEILWRKLVPPAEYMRRWDPNVGPTRSSLLRAYARRMTWVLRHAPRGAWAWYRARRSVVRREDRLRPSLRSHQSRPSPR